MPEFLSLLQDCVYTKKKKNLFHHSGAFLKQPNFHKKNKNKNQSSFVFIVALYFKVPDGYFHASPYLLYRTDLVTDLKTYIWRAISRETRTGLEVSGVEGELLDPTLRFVIHQTGTLILQTSPLAGGA